MKKAYKVVKITLFSLGITLANYKQVYAGPSPLQGDCIDSAIGCLPLSDTESFISFMLRWGIGIAGGVALLLIVYSAVQIMTAGGDPAKIQAGKELLTAAIAGFLFLLLSVFILQFVGVEILQIPGF